MSFKHLLVHTDTDKHCEKRLVFARDLAKRFGASLEGVFAKVPPGVLPAAEGGVTAQVIEAQQAFNERTSKEAEDLFKKTTAGGGVETTWTALDGYRTFVVGQRALFSDLVITGQPDPDESVATTDYDLPADVVMRSGRPVLIVPYAGTPPVEAKSAVIAWNGTREAVRAVADSLPLLAGAKVHVLAINPSEIAPGAGTGVEEICTYLGRHGIETDHDEIHTDELSPGDMILSRMSDLGAGLLVMGAYGHSRFREMILGGVTHHLLRHMTAPVLMAH